MSLRRLNGYTFSGGTSDLPAIAGMAIPSNFAFTGSLFSWT